LKEGAESKISDPHTEVEEDFKFSGILTLCRLVTFTDISTKDSSTVDSFETSVASYQLTRYYVPENLNPETKLTRISKNLLP
jgi:hypothetical protein